MTNTSSRKCPLCGGRVESRRRGRNVVMECAICSRFAVRQRPDDRDPHAILVLVESDFACGMLTFRDDEDVGGSRVLPVDMSDGSVVGVRVRGGRISGYAVGKGGAGQPEVSPGDNGGSNPQNPLEPTR